MTGPYGYEKMNKDLEKLSEGEPQPGGLAHQEGRTPSNVDQAELEKGIKVEGEHTSDPEKAKQIALDHLAEIPDYYTRLAKMEGEAKVESKSAGAVLERLAAS